MKEKLTKNWTNNLGMKLISLPLAFVLWIIIINIDDPTVSRNFPNVAIELLNVDAIDSLGKVYEIAEGNTVTVTVTGRRSVVDKVRSSDLKVTADLKQMSAFNKIDVEVSCEKYSYADLSYSTKPKMLTVSLEDKITRQFKVNVETIGSIDDNYHVGSFEAKPKMIEVSGAQSVVESISDVRVIVPLNDETANFKQTKLVPKAYDEAGKEIDSSKLEFSDSSITVKVNVQNTKIVPIEVSTVGTPAAGYGILQTDFDPRQIKVTGTDEALNQLTSIPVEVDVSNARSTIEKEIILTEYLPDGVTIVGTMNSIAVKVTIQQMEAKKVAFTISDIEAVNVPEGMHVIYKDSNRTYEVTVMGMESELAMISAEQLGAYVDVSNLTEGSHVVSIKFNPDENYIITSSPTISIDLLAGSGNIEDNNPETPFEPEDNQDNGIDEDEENLGTEGAEQEE